MKKAFSLFCVLVVIICCNGCTGDMSGIEGYSWKLKIASYLENDEMVVAMMDEASSAWPEAAVLEVTLTAIDGELYIVDHTNDVTYIGTYKLTGRDPGVINYDVNFDNCSGYALVGMTTYADGSQVPTLPLKVGKYTLEFYAE